MQLIPALAGSRPGTSGGGWNGGFEALDGPSEAVLSGDSRMQAFIGEARCQVVARFPTAESARGGLQSASSVLGRRWEASIEEVDEESEARHWEEEIAAQFLPVEVAPGLVVAPWDSRAAAGPRYANSATIFLEPSLAFGHGDHPTTRLCLSWLKKHMLQAERDERGPDGVHVLDYGSGSGVLAICSLLCGARSATATDCDELAVEMSRRNSTLNGVESRLKVLLVPENEPEPPGNDFDVLVANILKEPLLGLQSLFAASLRPGGYLAISGVLAEQADEVLCAYSADFTQLEVTYLEGWSLVTGVRKG